MDSGLWLVCVPVNKIETKSPSLSYLELRAHPPPTHRGPAKVGVRSSSSSCVGPVPTWLSWKLWTQPCGPSIVEEKQTGSLSVRFAWWEKRKEVTCSVGSTHPSGERTSPLIPGPKQLPLPSSPPTRPHNTQRLVAQLRRSELPHVPQTFAFSEMFLKMKINELGLQSCPFTL